MKFRATAINREVNPWGIAYSFTLTNVQGDLGGPLLLEDGVTAECRENSLYGAPYIKFNGPCSSAMDSGRYIGQLTLTLADYKAVRRHVSQGYLATRVFGEPEIEFTITEAVKT